MRISYWSSDVCSSDLYRQTVADIANLQTRSNSGAMVPIGSVANFEDRTGPYRVTRYNLFPAVEIDGDTAPGSSSGASLTTMEKLASESLPAGYGTEWTGIAFQQTARSEEHTSELQSLMRTPYAVFCLTKKKKK